MSCHFLFIGPLASRVVPLWWPQYLLLIVFDAFISFQFDFLECHNPLISRLSISISVVQMGKIRSNKTFYMLFATATPWLPAQLIWGLFCLLLFKLKVNLIRQDDLSCFEILGIFQLAVNERRSERKGNDINQSLTPESWTTLFCYYPFSNHFQSLYTSMYAILCFSFSLNLSRNWGSTRGGSRPEAPWWPPWHSVRSILHEMRMKACNWPVHPSLIPSK